MSFMQLIRKDILVKRGETKESPKLILPFILTLLQHVSPVVSLA